MDQALVALFLFLSAGCAQVLGLDTVTETDSVEHDASSFDARPDATDSLACVSAEIAPALGTTTGNTEAASNEVQLSCGSGAGNDLLLSWRAPVSDYYVFDTTGSAFDTVLGLLDACEGDELACNNNVGAGSTSELVVRLEQDMELVVAVDGFAGDNGDVTLNVSRVGCPDSDLQEQSFPLTLSTAGFADDFSNGCGGAGQEDRAYHWVPPAAGLYAFTVTAPGYRPIVTVIDGTRCGDTELGCSAALEPEFKSEVVRRLTTGQEVSVYVDGVDGTGGFTIDIKEVAATCPSGTLVEDMGAVAMFEPRTMSTSCSFPEIRNGVNIPEELGDKTFSVEIPPAGAGCFGSCQIEIHSAAIFSAALLSGGDCSGEELQCETADSGPDFSVILDVPMDEAESATHTLIVTDGNGQDGAGFTVLQSCQVACA